MDGGPTVQNVASLLSLILHSLQSGALTFVSLVSARLFGKLLSAKKHPEVKDDSSSVILLIFSYWWPYGRDFMAPLQVLSTWHPILCRRV